MLEHQSAKELAKKKGATMSVWDDEVSKTMFSPVDTVDAEDQLCVRQDNNSRERSSQFPRQDIKLSDITEIQAEPNSLQSNEAIHKPVESLPIKLFNRGKNVAATIRCGTIKNTTFPSLVIEFCPNHDGTRESWVNSASICLKLNELFALFIALQSRENNTLEFNYHDGNHFSIHIGNSYFQLSAIRKGVNLGIISGDMPYLLMLKLLTSQIFYSIAKKVYSDVPEKELCALVNSMISSSTSPS